MTAKTPRRRTPTKREGNRPRPPRSTTEDRLLTVKQVAGYLGISPKTLTNWRYDTQRAFNGPPYREIGGAIRYSEQDLMEWLEQQPVHGWSA